jgi:hypothetical protein
MFLFLFLFSISPSIIQYVCGNKHILIHEFNILDPRFGKKVTQWDSSNNGSISISISMPNSQHHHQHQHLHQHQHHLNYNETTLAASSSSSPEPFGTYTNSILIPEQDYSNRSETKISSQMSVRYFPL